VYLNKFKKASSLFKNGEAFLIKKLKTIEFSNINIQM